MIKYLEEFDKAIQDNTKIWTYGIAIDVSNLPYRKMEKINQIFARRLCQIKALQEAKTVPSTEAKTE